MGKLELCIGAQMNTPQLAIPRSVSSIVVGNDRIQEIGSEKQLTTASGIRRKQ
jgi:hypothetical protein